MALIPIDYVVPMVFPDDMVWRREFIKTCYATHMTIRPDAARYRSWGAEHLLIKCVRKFMPFVRNIFIILASESQVQPWMREEDVKLVYHADIIPAKHLPTYNSRTIEMYLHRIPGLSKLFIYANDDMFPLSPLERKDFFVGKTPCQHYEEEAYPQRPSQFEMACMNGLNFVAKDFGKQYTRTWLKGGHSLAPINIDTCITLWDKHAREIEASISKFRKVRNYNQYIYGWYQHLSGNYVDQVPQRHYAGVRLGQNRTLKIIKSPDCGIVCVNDNDSMFTIARFAAEVRKAISIKLEQ